MTKLTDTHTAPEAENIKIDRRSFLAKSAVAGAAVMLPVGGILSAATKAQAQGGGNHINEGDARILRFLAAAEILETDLWQQYEELANGNPDYMAALQNIDGDMPEYIEQNTEDEESHADFINAFLVSMHKQPVNLEQFRTLPGSTATGSKGKLRLTNLMHLNVDTSWYTRYRADLNPDFGDMPPQIVEIHNRPSIPLHDGYSQNQIQAIANTAAFHFAMIEQGGSSLYDVMSLKASSLVALRIITSIGGTEVAHYEIWNDTASNAPAVDSGDGLVFPDLHANTEFEAEQVMPKPCKFINANLPLCSVIRPTGVQLAGARAAVDFLTSTGLFQGQSQQFFHTLNRLADQADDARRHA